MTRKFVHLHCHSHYSLLDGANRIPELVAHVKKHGMNACALTDHGNLYGAVEFYSECRAAGVNPVVGYEAYVAPTKRGDREARRRGDAGFHLTLLAKNTTGFKNLVKMASAAFLDGYHYVPRIDKELLAAHKEGIVCLSGCASSEFSEFILKDQRAEALELARWFARLFGKDFYVEIQNNGLDIQRQCADGAIDVADKLGLPLVATSDAHYLEQGDAAAHEVLLCINTGKTLADENRLRYGSDQFYVRPPEEMYRLFPGHEAAVARSQEIADACDIRLDFTARHFPVFTPPKKKTPENYLRELCLEGLKDRYGPNPPDAAKARLDHELGIICRMGFASYFLVVWDFVRYAREQGIPATARGSGCGAIVSYVLKLSHVCPLEYDLLFERFLDPNRAEAPDIDIDFCQDRRELVIQYVKDKYGHGSVAQIATFGTLAAKAALKDVGRAYDVPLERVTAITKHVPARLHATLDDALAESPEFKREYETDPLVREWVDIARRLEGTNRNAGTHAAGVVIANGDLTDYVPLARVVRKGDDSGSRAGEVGVTTQWVMGDIEKIGLLKMDFLGLRNLTVLDNCVKLIKRTRGLDLDPQAFPLDDKKTYQLLQKGDAKGVFQLESDGMRELLKRMKPDNIRDLIAVLALYRPGPLGGGMVDAYVNRKHGREKWDYPHPVLKDILDETYGVMCIQEDTRIALADGREVPIREVKRGDLVHSLNRETLRFEVKECHGCGPTRRCDGVRVTLDNGFSVVLTDDHEVLTYDGFKPAGKLNPEHDLFAVGLRMESEPTRAEPLADWLGGDEDVAYFLGYLVGDGCLMGSGITLATGTKDNHDRLCAWMRERLPKLRQYEYFHMRSWYVTVSCPDLLNMAGHGNRKTRLHFLLDSLGMKVTALKKRVPAVIMSSPRPVRVAFLAGLLDADGCFAVTDLGVGVSFLTSAAPELLQDVRRLCQLEGVSVRLTRQRIQFWSLIALQAVIGPYQVIKAFVGRLTGGELIGWVPRTEVVERAVASGSVRAFCREAGIERSGLRNPLPFVRSRTAKRAGIDLGDVRYQRVVSVERVADQQFYGMSVEDHHNLVANGCVVKNCYQEQIMRILNRLGGIELSNAYACIKAISKKKQDVIDARQTEFVKGAQERGVSKEAAEEIYGLIVYFGGYGFNKSHTAAYAQIGYQTAYLKAHYTPEFMAALLSSEIDDGNKRDVFVEHIDDAKRLGCTVRPPDVNEGEPDFTVKDGAIVFGLTAIKGLGRGAAESIVAARADKGPFHDLYDFCERTDARLVNRTAVERLIKAGAFDRFGRRSALMAALPAAFDSAAVLQSDRKRGQLNFFDAMDADPAGGEPQPLPDVPEWPDGERLKFEKEALDFYFSSHPLAQQEAELKRYATHTVEQLMKMEPGQEVMIGGMLTQVRFMNTKKPGRNGNSRYVRCKVEDFTGVVECMMWPDEFVRFKDEFADDRVVLVRGGVEHKGDAPSLVLTRAMSMDAARRELTRSMILTLALNEHRPELLDQLAKELRRFPGPCTVWLRVLDAAGRAAKLRLGEQFRVDPAAVDVGRLDMLLGPGRVAFSGR